MLRLEAQVSANYGATERDGRRNIHVDIRGKDLSVLIGRRSETLGAFQYIASLIVGKLTQQFVQLVVDVEGYRDRREKQLVQMAKRMAEGGLKKLFSGFLGRHKAEETGPTDAEVRASFEQTVIRLQQMVEERSFVDVRFPGRADSVYQSLILKVDPHERYVLIDELFPAHGSCRRL